MDGCTATSIKEDLLLELIVCSEEVNEAWDSLSLIAQGLLLERKPLPHELEVSRLRHGLSDCMLRSVRSAINNAVSLYMRLWRRMC